MHRQRNHAPQGAARPRERKFFDLLENQAAHKLNQTFLTPIDRGDIAGFANSMDDVLDFTYATLNHLVLCDIHEIPTPPSRPRGSSASRRSTSRGAWGASGTSRIARR